MDTEKWHPQKALAEIERLHAALDDAEQRAAEAEAHLRTMLDVKGNSYCLWCHSWLKEGHKPDCPRQVAAKWIASLGKEQDG